MSKTFKFVKNSLSLCLLSVMASLLFTGCPDAQKMASDTLRSLDREKVAYDQLVQSANQRGEASAKNLEVWSKALGDLNGRVSSINERLEKKPQEKPKAEGELAMLKASLDPIFTRPDTLILALVPSWMMENANQSRERAKATLLDLRRNYLKLFGLMAPGSETFTIELNLDESLYDTYNDCLVRFKLFSQQRILSYGDYSCEGEGQKRCGHQMDIACLNTKLMLNLNNSCIEIVDRIVPSYARDKTTPVDNSRPATWLNEIAACNSAAPVLKSSVSR